MPQGTSALSRLIASALSLLRRDAGRRSPKRWNKRKSRQPRGVVARRKHRSTARRPLRQRSPLASGGFDRCVMVESRPVVNVAADRIVFELDWFTATAIEVEVERAALNALSSRRSSGGGSPPLHDWDGAKRYVDAYVAKHGPLANRTRVAELFEENFTNLREEPPTRESIYRWLRQKAQQTWVSQVVQTP